MEVRAVELTRFGYELKQCSKCFEIKSTDGLLCNNCNRGLGHLKEAPEVMTTLKEYLG